MKKLLSLLVALCVFSAQLAYVSAADASEDAVVTESAVEALQDLGLMNGDENGNLNGDKSVTRAEFVTLLSRIDSNYRGAAQQSFTDVSATHWASEYIGYFTNAGVIDGYDDGRFGPDDQVNLTQAVKMLLSVLGLAKDSFVYPDDYLLTAAKRGMTVGVDVLPEATLVRNEAAALILNALYAEAADGSQLIDDLDKKFYYLSVDGSDDGDGSYAKPWKTLAKAAASANGNAIVYLADGVYEESSVAVFNRGGASAEQPLLIKPSYGATVEIVYSDAEGAEIVVSDGANYITMKNLVLTSTAAADDAKATEALIECSAKGFSFLNNMVADAANAVSVKNGSDAKIIGNTFTGGKTAISLAGSTGAVVKGNTFNGQTEAGLAAGGASKNTQIYNNTFNVGDELTNAAIVLGDENGVYNNVLWNNVVYADGEQITAVGIACKNTTDCHFYNNIVAGTVGAIRFGANNVKPVLRNNIFTECGGQSYIFEGGFVNVDSDYNCFNDAYPQIKEKNSKYSNPFFVSEGEDWNLISFSPAKGTGIEIDSEFVGFGGETILLDMRDFDGLERSGSWNMGVHNGNGKASVSVGEGEEGDAEAALGATQNVRQPFWSLNFEKDTDEDKLLLSGGEWSIKNGVYCQDSTYQGRLTAVYEGGDEWENYEVTADIKSTSAIAENATGLIFRSDLEMLNMYSFRFLANDRVQFVMWKDGTYKLIKNWDYVYQPETFYNFKVVANGNKFTFYINDVLLDEVVDDSFSSGTVGFYSYKEPNEYDNLKVYTVQ